MMSPGHLAFSAAAWTTVAAAVDVPVWQRCAGMVYVLATATLPDCDQSEGWKMLVPNGGFIASVLSHRRLTHSWMLPAFLLYSDWLPAHHIDWAVLAIATSWLGHILADFLFGRGGVPLIGWGFRWGLELPMRGLLEAGTGIACTVYAVLTVWAGPMEWVALIQRAQT